MALIDDVIATRNAPFQLVKHYDDVHDKHKKFPVWLDIKYDGVFCAVIIEDGVKQFVSRTGKLFYALCLIGLDTPEEDGVWIGELVNNSLSLEELSGLVNPNRVNYWEDEEEESMRNTYIVYHDALTLYEFKLGLSSIKYMDRRDRLPNSVDLSAGWLVHDKDTLEVDSKEVIRDGHEGVCIKDLSAGWLAGHKGWHITKIVRDIHLDLRCLAVDTGKGKRAGQIARLQFAYGDRTFWADLGKGWTDEKRIELTRNWEIAMDWVSSQNEFGTIKNVPYHALNPVGKVFHVKALQVSSKGVLRLAKVQEMRVDKDIEDVATISN